MFIFTENRKPKTENGITTPLPPPPAVNKILLWHQGALGDLLLAGPAFLALSRHYPQARVTGVGHPERWGLLAGTLPLEAVWDGAEAAWAGLFSPAAPLPEALRARLAPFQLALVFSPRPPSTLPARLAQAGIPGVYWIPSFPALNDSLIPFSDSGTTTINNNNLLINQVFFTENRKTKNENGINNQSGAGESSSGARLGMARREPVAALQARRLAALGLPYEPQPFRLAGVDNPTRDELPELPGGGPWMAVAPGSGHPAKNWPLAHYYEVTRALAWELGLKVVWLAGPAEMSLLPYLKALAEAQGHLLLAQAPLRRVAAVLTRCRLFLGGDSGLTHLAAAAGAPAVLALFGPTDPQIWAPQGPQITNLIHALPCAPCTLGRDITCPAPQCLTDLTPEQVLAAARAILGTG